MDNLVSEANDVMSPSLDFGLPNTAQYVIDRKHVNYFSNSGNIYTSGAGNKQIKFYITGEDNTYLDLSSVRLFANLQNDDATATHFLRPLSGLHGFFSRLRITVGGQLVEDIDVYARHCELYNSFKSQDVRDMDDIESGAQPRWDDDWRHTYATGLDQFIQVNGAGDGVELAPDGPDHRDHNNWGDLTYRPTRHSMSGIRGGGEYMRLGHKFSSGFLNASYYLPVRYAPLEIEITLVSDENLPVIQPTLDATATAGGGDGAGYYFTTGNTSTTWQINNILLRAETVMIDSQVNNNITRHLLEGGSLKMVYPMYHTITQTFNNARTEINMNIVKSVSKLNGVFLTFYRPQRGAHLTDGKLDGYYLPDNYVYKRWNYFYNPMINSRIFDRGTGATGANAGYGFQDKNKNISFQIQIANKKYPEFESQSLAEHFYFLRRTLNYLNPDQDACSISYKQYREDKFVCAISFEKMPENKFSGSNTKMGSLLTTKIKPYATLGENEGFEEVFAHLVSEGVVEIRESGAIVYD